MIAFLDFDKIKLEIVKDDDKVPMLLFPEGEYEFIYGGISTKHTLSSVLLIDLLKVNFIQFFKFVRVGAYFDDNYWLNPDNRKIKEANQLFIEREFNPWQPNEPLKVTWDEANAFATWTGKRLLREKEWEVYAAFMMGLVHTINGKKLSGNTPSERKQILWTKIHQAGLNYNQNIFEKEFAPMAKPPEWCADEENGKRVIKGYITGIPSIATRDVKEASELFSFRCCKTRG